MRLFNRQLTARDWPHWLAQQQQNAQDPLLKSYYDQGTFAGETPAQHVDFVALDFETTGLNSDMDDIVSIGLVPFDLRRIYCRQAKHWYVRPQKPLRESSIVIHGITHTALNDAPDLIDILRPLLQSLAGKVVVAHYCQIERQFLQCAIFQRLRENLEFPIVDTMQLEARIIQSRLGFWQRLKQPRVSVRLGRCRTRYGLPPYPPHHALTDAIATAELLQAQLIHTDTMNTRIANLWN